MNGVKRIGVKGKLSLYYIGPFPLLEKCGTMADHCRHVSRHYVPLYVMHLKLDVVIGDPNTSSLFTSSS
jgi:hypothetical protein